MIYNSMIPKKIFQTWKTPTAFQYLKNSWIENNPDFEYHFSSDEDCRDFLRSFDKEVFETYEMIIPGAFKADLWRFSILYVFGGFYCDIDTFCLSSIKNFVNEKTEFISPIDLNRRSKTGHNLFNSFIGVLPNSVIMQDCIDQIKYNVKHRITEIPALDFSSCGVLGMALNNFLKLERKSSFIGKEGIINDTVHLLKFEKSIEYVKDVNGNILLQNKNGNKNIFETYKSECKKDGVVPWIYEKNWIKKKNVTLL